MNAHSSCETEALASTAVQALVQPHSVPAATGTAVVLLHGLCSTPDELLPVQAALRCAGHTVHPLRIAGYSFENALARQRASSHRDWIDAVEALVLRLQTSYQRVIVGGISAGATLALAAAIRCGHHIDALLLLSTPLRADGWAIPRSRALLPLALYTPLGRFWQYRESSPYGVKNERVRAWIERELKDRRVSSAGSAVLGVAHLREHDRLARHVRRNLHQVRCREVLAIHAREDEVASLSNLDLLARGLGACGHLRTVVLDNSYHMISIDNDRQQVAREAFAFAAAITLAIPPVQAVPGAIEPSNSSSCSGSFV
jgi:carboxylesterase